MCKLVDNLEANDPKMFPLIPIAPGITTKRPGNVSRKNVILPNMTPAIKSPIAHIKRAIKPSSIELLWISKNSKKADFDSELRILFCLSFTIITTYYHFYHFFIRLLIHLEYHQKNRFRLQVFQVNLHLRRFLLKLMCLLAIEWFFYPDHKSRIRLF